MSAQFRHRWKDAVMQSGLSTGTKVVAYGIAAYANETSRSGYPGYGQIAAKFNVPLRSVERAVAELIDAGFLIAQKTKFRSSKLLTLMLPDTASDASPTRQSGGFDEPPQPANLAGSHVSEPAKYGGTNPPNLVSEPAKLAGPYIDEPEEEPESEPEAAERPKESEGTIPTKVIRRMTTDDAQLARIGVEACRLVGITFDSRTLIDGQQPDRWILDRLGSATTQRLCARARAGELPEADLVLALRAAGVADELERVRAA